MLEDIRRREFLKKMGLASAAFGAGRLYGSGISREAFTSNMIWVEAQTFANKGGWVVDQQHMDQMGAPYLMAHGVGVPVSDAVTRVKVAKPGRYRVWLRTHNWNALWTSPAAGQFRLKLNGRPLDKVFGQGAEGWLWEDGGVVELNSHEIELGLNDLTGFNGRCDAIFFSKDLNFVPPNRPDALREFRRAAMGLEDRAPSAGRFDLVVVGGGGAGITCAISAARLGLRTAVINNRPVWGGNNSSEVGILAQAKMCLDPYPKVGIVTRDVCNSNGRIKSHRQKIPYTQGEQIAQEDNLTGFANMHATRVEMAGDRIRSVTCQHIETGEEIRFEAPLFVDSSGDGNLGYLAGADFREGRESRAEHGESLAPEVADNLKNGTSNLWAASKEETPSEFPRCPWAVQFTEEMFTLGYFRGQVKQLHIKANSDWFWQTGWNLDTVRDAERIRDYNLMACFGYWSFVKNDSSKANHYKKHKIWRCDYVNGKRESRRILGDHILTQQDVDNQTVIKDAFFQGTYEIDMHFGPTKRVFPHGDFLLHKRVHNKVHMPGKPASGDNNNPPYPISFGCLYSRNISNLMMAGRCGSFTHIGHSSARLINTGGMMGEVVAMAASLCANYDCSPRDIRSSRLPKLRHLAEMGIPWV